MTLPPTKKQCLMDFFLKTKPDVKMTDNRTRTRELEILKVVIL